MWQLAAIEGRAPSCWAVLTAREHLTRKDTYRHLEQLREAAKRRWPDVGWGVSVEFQRRGALHLNLTIVGVPASDVDELRRVLVERWCDRVDAEPWAQFVDVIDDARGVLSYIVDKLSHGLKAEQAPPLGWRGHRTSQTRNYLPWPASEGRERARAELAAKRRLWRAFETAADVVGEGHVVPGDLVEVVYEQLEARDLERAGSWRLVGHVGRSEAAERRDAARAPFESLRRRAESRSPALPAPTPTTDLPESVGDADSPGRAPAPVDRGTPPDREGAGIPARGAPRAARPEGGSDAWP
jgi:hypothetical protein